MATSSLAPTPQPCAAPPTSPTRAAIVSSVEGLSQLRDPRYDLAIWTRELPRWVHDESAAFADRHAGLRRHAEVVAARPRSFDPLVAEVPEGPLRAFFRSEFSLLTACFGALVGRTHVHGTLQVVTKDMCRKLHADNVPLRLLCTYAGPGTHWVDGADVRSEHLARADLSIDEANDRVLGGDWSRLRQARMGDVVLLKGYHWRGEDRAGARSRAAVHRSPLVEAKGLRRLLFKLDVYPCGY